jgi:hypothetical protein
MEENEKETKTGAEDREEEDECERREMKKRLRKE